MGGYRRKDKFFLYEGMVIYMADRYLGSTIWCVGQISLYSSPGI
jgi:hypothetical protein